MAITETDLKFTKSLDYNALAGMTPDQSAVSDMAVSQEYVPYEVPTALRQFADYLSKRILSGGSSDE